MIKITGNYSSRFYYLACFCLCFLVSTTASANAPKVGKAAAAKYFQNKGQRQAQNQDLPKSASQLDEGEEYQAQPARKASRYVAQAGEKIRPDDHYLTFGLSSYLSDESFSWGQDGKETEVGKWGFDINYRLGEYPNLMDELFKISYNEYKPNGERAAKLSVLYAISFPESSTQFPLYFGAAGGLGVFTTQLSGSSSISFDYQLYLGVRLFNLYENTGFYVEGGIKNHILLTSKGQLNGTYVSAGGVFTF